MTEFSEEKQKKAAGEQGVEVSGESFEAPKKGSEASEEYSEALGKEFETPGGNFEAPEKIFETSWKIFETSGKKDFVLAADDALLRETFRYLGYRNTDPDERVRKATEDAIQELIAVSRPKAIWRSFSLEIAGATDNGSAFTDDSCVDNGAVSTGDFSTASGNSFPQLRFAGLSVESRDLSKNLAGCDSVILFAATLGAGADMLIRRKEIAKISDAVILQAAGAALVEQVCDSLNDKLAEAAAAEGFRLHPRYSPGYGDFSLDYQQDVIALLGAGKELGITLTEGSLMAPGKSVTALIGAEKQDIKGSFYEICT